MSSVKITQLYIPYHKPVRPAAHYPPHRVIATMGWVPVGVVLTVELGRPNKNVHERHDDYFS